VAKKCIRVLISIAAPLLIFIGGWILMYPGSNDSKNIKYVLWKHGLYRMDINTATAVMVGDSARDKLIIGRTKTQIQNIFGVLIAPEETTPYYRNCYKNSAWKDMKALYIDHSPWLIVFDKGKAIKLILIKGS